jgi:glycerol-3-phosphate dehydrogenase
VAVAENQRTRSLRALADERFDLAVIGGGITGAGIARDAALRGLKVALIEKLDFGAGTSSKSTKLIHGGIRYLEQGELKLVFESVNERNRQMRLARHLVRPLPFLFARYRGDRRFLLTLDAGLYLYEALCLFRGYKNHRTFRAQKTRALEPGLRPDGLTGAVLYYDAMTDDARLTLENIMDAAALGATVVNHVRATALLRDGSRVVGVMATDELSQAPLEIRATAVVNATGPWCDEVRAMGGDQPLLRPTKGVHVVVDARRLPARHALVMTHPRDKRVMFTIPWGLGRTVVGTTDTFFSGSADRVDPTAQDIEYLLEAANHYYPDSKLGPDDVISTWSGLRPLLRPPDSTASASSVSREHVILERDGLFTIAGGKLTTYRSMAAEVVDRVAPASSSAKSSSAKSSSTSARPLPGARGIEDSDEALEGYRRSLETSFPQASALVDMYGSRAGEVLTRCQASVGAQQRLDPELPWVLGQVDEAIENEFAVTLDDVFSRRLTLVLRAKDQGLAAMALVVEHMAQRLGWSPQRCARELETYRAVVNASRAWRSDSAPREREPLRHTTHLG